MNKCEKCRFKRCEDYESQCYVCLFSFDECSLKHLEKLKLERLMESIEVMLCKENNPFVREETNRRIQRYNEYSKKLAKASGQVRLC